MKVADILIVDEDVTFSEPAFTHGNQERISTSRSQLCLKPLHRPFKKRKGAAAFLLTITHCQNEVKKTKQS